MSIITHDYLTHINNKYDISKLIGYVLNRYNRCSFERVIACLLQKEQKKDSLLGNVHKYFEDHDYAWGLPFKEVAKHKHKQLPIIKFWSGR